MDVFKKLCLLTINVISAAPFQIQSTAGKYVDDTLLKYNQRQNGSSQHTVLFSSNHIELVSWYIPR